MPTIRSRCLPRPLPTTYIERCRVSIGKLIEAYRRYLIIVEIYKHIFISLIWAWISLDLLGRKASASIRNIATLHTQP